MSPLSQCHHCHKRNTHAHAHAHTHIHRNIHKLHIQTYTHMSLWKLGSLGGGMEERGTIPWTLWDIKANSGWDEGGLVKYAEWKDDVWCVTADDPNEAGCVCRVDLWREPSRPRDHQQTRAWHGRGGWRTVSLTLSAYADTVSTLLIFFWLYSFCILFLTLCLFVCTGGALYFIQLNVFEICFSSVLCNKVLAVLI